jgi:hypothetical protein
VNRSREVGGDSSRGDSQPYLARLVLLSHAEDRRAAPQRMSVKLDGGKRRVSAIRVRKPPQIAVQQMTWFMARRIVLVRGGL